MQAIQYQFTATVDGIKHDHRAIAWTLKSKFDKICSLLESTVRSFREISK